MFLIHDPVLMYKDQTLDDVSLMLQTADLFLSVALCLLMYIYFSIGY